MIVSYRDCNGNGFGREGGGCLVAKVEGEFAKDGAECGGSGGGRSEDCYLVREDGMLGDANVGWQG